jgi:DNA excision repair protein ERCC-2
MSATLAPMDVFRTVTGLDLLAGGDVGEAGGSGAASAATASAATETGRRVESSVFGMGFPDTNRESLAVDLPAFTYSNRGTAGADNEVRETYARVLATVAATTPGNVLIAMPSYAEAEWAAEAVAASADVSKPVLCDEPSTNAVTERRKDAFFAGEGKVLATSLRGTLTEGVDYPGEKLRAAVVCGVPIVNTGSPIPTAIETAYDSRFGADVGFEYAFTVPAVRKARQALGRVIRGPEDVGVRVLVDERYASTRPWNSVREYLPETEREAFEPAQPNAVAERLRAFWRQHR